MSYAEVQHGGFADSSVGATTVRRISWGAVLAGVAIILVIQLAMALLGAAIGFSLVEPVARDTPQPTSIGIGAGIYWVISAIISLHLFLSNRPPAKSGSTDSRLRTPAVRLPPARSGFISEV